jgi:hypothetical protein
VFDPVSDRPLLPRAPLHHQPQPEIGVFGHFHLQAPACVSAHNGATLWVREMESACEPGPFPMRGDLSPTPVPHCRHEVPGALSSGLPSMLPFCLLLGSLGSIEAPGSSPVPLQWALSPGAPQQTWSLLTLGPRHL